MASRSCTAYHISSHMLNLSDTILIFTSCTWNTEDLLLPANTNVTVTYLKSHQYAAKDKDRRTGRKPRAINCCPPRTTSARLPPETERHVPHIRWHLCHSERELVVQLVPVGYGENVTKSRASTRRCWGTSSGRFLHHRSRPGSVYSMRGIEI